MPSPLLLSSANSSFILTLNKIALTPDPRDTESITSYSVTEYADYGALADLQGYESIHPLNFKTKKKYVLILKRISKHFINVF
jgi:hypothetical protein